MLLEVALLDRRPRLASVVLMEPKLKPTEMHDFVQITIFNVQITIFKRQAPRSRNVS